MEIVQDRPRFVEHERLQGWQIVLNQKQATPCTMTDLDTDKSPMRNPSGRRQSVFAILTLSNVNV